MAWFDFFRSRTDPAQQAALQIDLDTGVLDRCPVCHEIVDKQRDDRLIEADRRAERMIADADPLVRTLRGDLDRLQRLLRDVRRPYPYSCRCEAYD